VVVVGAAVRLTVCADATPASPEASRRKDAAMPVFNSDGFIVLEFMSILLTLNSLR
jgi:hypothetical protein